MSKDALRCPETSCTGWVSEVDDGHEHFWGCGECGTTWFEQNELDQAITEAIEKHPYRKKCYRKSKQSWIGVSLEKEPKDYEALVEQECDDTESTNDQNLACPISMCEGTVLFMKDESADGGDPARWLCDCCDSSWIDERNLFREIADIIKKYPYRAKLYRKEGDAWHPVEWDGDILDYMDLVDQEEEDSNEGQQRG